MVNLQELFPVIHGWKSLSELNHFLILATSMFNYVRIEIRTYLFETKSHLSRDVNGELIRIEIE